MQHKYLFLLVISIGLMRVSAAQACRCISPNPDRDAALIKEADAIVALDVLESEIGRGDIDEALFMPAKVKLQKIYKGDLQEGQELTIWSKAYGSCTHNLGAGGKAELLLFKQDKGYTLGAPCSYISIEAWEKLKQR